MAPNAHIGKDHRPAEITQLCKTKDFVAALKIVKATFPSRPDDYVDEIRFAIGRVKNIPKDFFKTTIEETAGLANEFRDQILSSIAKVLSDSDHFDSALGVSKMIRDQLCKNTSILDIVQSLAFNRRFEKAYEIANSRPYMGVYNPYFPDNIQDVNVIQRVQRIEKQLTNQIASSAAQPACTAPKDPPSQ